GMDEELFALVHKGRLRPEVQPFPLEEVNEALARLRSVKMRGAAVLTMNRTNLAQVCSASFPLTRICCDQYACSLEMVFSIRWTKRGNGSPWSYGGVLVRNRYFSCFNASQVVR